MTAPKRSPLAAKILEIEDTLAEWNHQFEQTEVVVPAKHWAELVQCASAVELLDAVEAAPMTAVEAECHSDIVGVLNMLPQESRMRVLRALGVKHG